MSKPRTELVCNNMECPCNKPEICVECNGKKVNFRGQRCLTCNGIGYKSAPEKAFVVTVIEIVKLDVELYPDGVLGDNLTAKYDDDPQESQYVLSIHCRHCDNDIPIPNGWTGTDPEYQKIAIQAKQLQEKQEILGDTMVKHG